MTRTEADLARLLRLLRPVRNAGVYVFASLPHGIALPSLDPVATMREKEGWTVVVDEHQARAANLRVLFRAAWITLEVQSGLDAVGLTATISATLAQAGISCNVVAGAFHDHLFVPYEEGQAALELLLALQRTQPPGDTR